MLIIISGPSGVGKSSVICELLLRHKNLKVLKSYTTRSYRSKIDGEYFHVTPEQFKKLQSEGKFFEVENVHADIFYATSFAELEKVIEARHDFIKDLDVHGAQKIAKFLQGKVEVVTVFLDSPDKVLKQRLIGRGESKEMTKKRLSRVEMERGFKPLYDIVIDCDDVKRTADAIEKYVGDRIK